MAIRRINWNWVLLAACGLTMCACTGGSDIKMPTGNLASNVNDDDDAFDEIDTDSDLDGKDSRTAFPGTRVKDVSEEFDFEDIEDESDDRSKDSDCEFFTSNGTLSLTEKPEDFRNTSTIIDHFPPAEYPMPVNETFSGDWDGDSYKFIALVDIKISYSAHDPYESKWKTALPDSEEDSAYERRYYKVTIKDAESDNCKVTYTKDSQ